MNTAVLGAKTAAKTPPAEFERHGRTRPKWLSPWFRAPVPVDSGNKPAA
jgi:hypothetical protein